MGLFSKKFINPKEYTHSGTKGMIYLLDDVVYSQAKMKELRKLVMSDMEDDIHLKFLTTSTYNKIVSYYNTAESSFRSAASTNTVDTFFKKWSVGTEAYHSMIPIEKYIYNGIMSSSEGLEKANLRKQIEIRHLIDRVYAKALEKSSVAKTEAARKKCFTSAYSKLANFKSEFDEMSLKKLDKKFAKYLSEV